jgi:hypothetical protein
LTLVALASSVLVADAWQTRDSFVFADIALLGLVVASVLPLLGRGPTRTAWSLIAIGWALLVAGNLIGSGVAGFPRWALLATARNVTPPIVFAAAAGAFAHRGRASALAFRILVASACVQSLLVAVSSQLRGEGTFGNPNYAANYMVVALLVLPFARLARRVQFLVGCILLVGITQTGSFAAMAMVIAAAGYLMWRRLTTLPFELRVAARVLLVLGLAGCILVADRSIAAFSQSSDQSVDLGSGLNSTRFERSHANRLSFYSDGLQLYIENPLGVGPSGLDNRPELRDRALSGETHNDLLDALLGAGPAGAAGELVIILAIWRVLRKNPHAAALLVALATASLFRQQWNFRHIWLVLGCLVATQLWPHARVGGTGDRAAQGAGSAS